MGPRRRRRAGRRGPKPRHKVALTGPEYRELQGLARRRTASYAEVVRAKILLLAYEHPDWSNAAIVARHQEGREFRPAALIPLTAATVSASLRRRAAGSSRLRW